jgi:streptogrisin C
MQRRTIAVIAATVTAAGAAVAFTLPSMASTTPATKATDASDAVAPQMLSAMKRDLGLSPAQATAAVKRATWAAGVTTTLKASTGSAWAGSWLTDQGTTLNVAVTDPAQAAKVKAAGAIPKLVAHSSAQLDAAKQTLDTTAGTKATKVLAGWAVDVAANKVAITALPGQTAAAEELAAKAGIPSSELKVVTTKSAPKTLADLSGGDAYFISLDEGLARCSIGFAVEGGFVTAGHCGAVGDQASESAAGDGSDLQPLGAVSASVFPGDADFGVVKVTGDFTVQPLIDDFNNNQLPVAGSTAAPIGATVCRSGSTTGLHCGTILALNQTVNYPEGTVTGLTETDACAEGGDSGGSWFVGDQAQGVTSGGSGDCTVGGETFFQPVNEILQRNNLTLLTTTGGGATTPPSADPSAAPTASVPASTAPATTAPAHRHHRKHHNN